jgi:hypothetical protein
MRKALRAKGAGREARAGRQLVCGFLGLATIKSERERERHSAQAWIMFDRSSSSMQMLHWYRGSSPCTTTTTASEPSAVVAAIAAVAASGIWSMLVKRFARAQARAAAESVI